MNLHTIEKGTGPDLVLLHGNFGDSLDWAPVLDPLARHFHVIAVDLPGFGRSPKPDAPYDAPFFVEALDAFFQSRNLQRIPVLGHSLGGQMAVALALAHPDRVSKLVLTDAGGFYQYPEMHLAMLRPRFAEAVIAGLTPEQVCLMFQAMFITPTPDTDAYLDKQVAQLKQPYWPGIARTASRAFHFHVDYCLLPHLARITWPTLLVWGEKDMVVPLIQAQTALPQLPNATLEVIPNCGHAPQIERPQDLLTHVLPFLLQP